MSVRALLCSMKSEPSSKECSTEEMHPIRKNNDEITTETNVHAIDKNSTERECSNECDSVCHTFAYQ